MASFSGNVDLLALNGAKVLVGIDEKNAKASLRLHSSRCERN